MLLEQAEREVYELLDLGFGRCDMVVAARRGDDALGEALRRLGRVRVATKYPRMAAAYFAETGRQAEIVEVKGSVELAPLTGLVDGIVDLTATGTTLRENDLEVLEEIDGLHGAPDRQPRGPQAQGRGDRRAGGPHPGRAVRVVRRAPARPRPARREGWPHGRGGGSEIVEAVRSGGDAAVLELVARVDRARAGSPDELRVPAEELRPPRWPRWTHEVRRGLELASEQRARAGRGPVARAGPASTLDQGQRMRVERGARARRRACTPPAAARRTPRRW